MTVQGIAVTTFTRVNTRQPTKTRDKMTVQRIAVTTFTRENTGQPTKIRDKMTVQGIAVTTFTRENTGQPPPPPPNTGQNDDAGDSCNYIYRVFNLLKRVERLYHNI